MIKINIKDEIVWISGLSKRNSNKCKEYLDIVDILNNGGHMSVTQTPTHNAMSIYNGVTLTHVVNFKSRKTLVSLNMKMIEDTSCKYAIC